MLPCLVQNYKQILGYQHLQFFFWMLNTKKNELFISNKYLLQFIDFLLQGQLEFCFPTEAKSPKYNIW